MSSTKLHATYQALSPDVVLNAIESQGFEVNASILGLNSYENRVYQVGLENGQYIIAKFYRPERWSNAQILEEHAFSESLFQNEIPIVAPIKNTQGQSLFVFEGYRFALFPRKGGYAPEPGDLKQLERLGTLLGRIHQHSAGQQFQFRPTYSIERLFKEPVAFLLKENFIPEHFIASYKSICNILLEKITLQTGNFKHYKMIKCHGDWHLGNILWLEESGGHIVDLDDCMNAPAIQDIWMMLSGDKPEQALQLEAVLKGYKYFCDFDYSQVKLIESLRTMRIIHYSAWLAKRWSDPAFPQNFPWFDSPGYWQQHIRELEEQIALIDSDIFSE